MMRRLSRLASLALTLSLLSAGSARFAFADPGFDDFEMSSAKAQWDAWIPQIEAAVQAGDKKALAKDLTPEASVTLVYDGETSQNLLANDERGWQEVLQALKEGQIDTLDQRQEGHGILQRVRWHRERDGHTTKSREVNARYDSDAGWHIESVLIRDPLHPASILQAQSDSDDDH